MPRTRCKRWRRGFFTCATTGNQGNRDFTFDARNRLIKASAPNQAWISSEYQYDSLDNIKLARLGTRQYNYTQNALNQLASITQPSTTPSATNYALGSCADASLIADLGNGSTGPSVAIPSAGTAGTATTGGAQTAKYTFTTDNEGRMTQKGTQAYVYDALNRMIQVTTKESYIYDGHGRRVQTTKTSDGSINYPMYSLDGKLLLEDNRQTLQRIEYIYAGGRLVAKKIQPITSTGANNGTATTTTIHTDFLGSPVTETNAAGTVTRVERYTPYGEPSDMQLDAGPGFTGHATDVATGLTYMQQRYYDAEIGRFLTPDPVGPEEDFINHFNRYNYAQNNPVRYTDPDGRIVVVAGTKEYQAKVNADIERGKKIEPGFASRMKQLDDSKNTHTITDAKIDKDGPFNATYALTKVGQTDEQATADTENGVGAGTEILYDPENEMTSIGIERPPIMGLAHEVSHAAEIDTGTRVKETTEDNAAKAAGDMKNGIDNEPPEVSVLPKIDEVK